jgi:hypothetical protein
MEKAYANKHFFEAIAKKYERRTARVMGLLVHKSPFGPEVVIPRPLFLGILSFP